MILQFADKDPDEEIVLSMDFSALMGNGESVVGAETSITKSDNAMDVSVQMVSGAADITAAPIVRQKVKGGAAGTDYLMRVKVTTSGERVLVGGAKLPVRLGA